jgi:hypothetical protein
MPNEVAAHSPIQLSILVLSYGQNASASRWRLFAKNGREVGQLFSAFGDSRRNEHHGLLQLWNIRFRTGIRINRATTTLP